MRAISASASRWFRRSFSTSRRIAFTIDALAFDVAPSRASAMITSWPAAAATCAIPVPIAPAPTTPTTVVLSSAMLLPGEHWLSLFEKRVHTLGVISRPASLALQFLFEIQLIVEVDAERRVEAPFDQPEPARGLRRQVACR